MDRCVCAVSGRGSGVIQVGPLYHPCCVDCGSLKGLTYAVRAAAQLVLDRHREGHK